MQMEDRLPRVRTNVIDRAKAILQAAFAGEFSGNQVRVADNLLIGLGQMVNADDVLLGDDQNVRRCARLDVFKSEDLLIFVNLL